MNAGRRPGLRETTERRVVRPLSRQAVIDESYSTSSRPGVQLRRYIKFLTSGSRGWGDYYADQGERFLRIGNLPRANLEIRGDIQFVDLPADVTEGSRTMLQEGDLLFSITAYLGSVAVVEGDWVGAYVSQHVALCRLERARVDPRFIGWFMLSATGQDQLNEGAAGGTKMQLALDDIRGLRVPMVPIEEQRRIAAYLDRETARIDTLIEEQQRLIDMLRERRQALIERSMLESSDAPLRLSRIASSRSGDVPPPLEEDGQHVVWGAGRMVGHTSQVNAQAGDLLVGRVGQGSVGKIRRLTENAWATDNTIILRLNLSAADPRYIEHGLRLIPRFELVGGGAMPLVTAERLLAQLVPFTTLATQQRIADRLDLQTAKIDLLITETARFIELSRERRSALIAAAVTGQINVREMA